MSSDWKDDKDNKTNRITPQQKLLWQRNDWCNDLHPMMHKWYDSRSFERVFNYNVSVPSDDPQTMESENVTMKTLTKL